jgi:CMP-N-acetylneuraminic acid synthetase
VIKGKTVLAIILARGGSKRLPGKNVKILGDKPLIAWTIEAAKKSKYIDRIIVSTDSKNIKNVALDWGAETPFLRPSHLATDGASSEVAIIHAIDYLQQNESIGYDYFILLQPTSPFRKGVHIDEAIKKLSESVDASTVISVCEVDRGSINLTGTKLFPNSAINGAIYICKTNVFTEDNSFYKRNCLAYTMSKEASLDIDIIDDWELAKKMINKN